MTKLKGQSTGQIYTRVAGSTIRYNKQSMLCHRHSTASC